MRKDYSFAEPPYSLHDMPVHFSADGDTLTLTTEYGMQSPEPPFMTSSGRLVFRSVKWDESCAYILSPRGSFGVFEGEKLTLDELLGRYPGLSLDVMDEYFGVNRARFCGFVDINGECRELAVEIYHADGLTYTADEDGEGS